nr:bifunctional 3'-5' exonuclease/DNA polymerase [Herbiconiux solani]
MTCSLDELPDAVARLERVERPRWVWSDSARWYPGLLAASVRIERCVDLRLAHTILRASELTAASELATAPASEWDSMPALGNPGTPGNPGGAGGPGGSGGSGNPGYPGGAVAPDGILDVVTHRRTHDTALFDDDLVEAAPVSHTAAGPSSGRPRITEAEEFRRQRAAIAGATDPSRIALLVAAESAGSLAAAEMQHVGLPWSAAEHDRILTDLLGPRPGSQAAAAPAASHPTTAPGTASPPAAPRAAAGTPAAGTAATTATPTRPARMAELLDRIRAELGDPTANPDSPVELLKALRRAGIDARSTRSWELKSLDHPAIPPLLEYKKLSRLLSANGWNWLDTWVRDGRFHPHYIPGGVVTGRWASEGGGALQLPKQVRGAVRADPGWTFVVADAAQLEPRVLAALAGDRAMAAAGRGLDLYDGIVASGAVDTRAHAKLGMLGAMYGGTSGESGRMLPRLARAYPAAIAFVEAAARAGEAGNRVSTRLGRTSPRPGDDWLDVQDAARADGATDAQRSRARSAARSWGRFTRNFVVQGTAAEWALCWLASLRTRLWELGAPTATAEAAPLERRPHLAFFLHDEVVVHTPREHAEAVAEALRHSAAEAGRLIFGDAPVEFPITVATVDSYDKAK